MTGRDITELFERLGRLSAATKEQSGSGTYWHYTFPDGTVQRYAFRGIRCYTDIEDTLFNLLIWIWNTKDYLKERAVTNGIDPRPIEDAVDADAHLVICADLANRLKHGELKWSRSDHYPHLGRVTYTVPGRAVSQIIARGAELDFEISQPDLVEFRVPVFTRTGQQLGDAFEYAERGLIAFEKLRKLAENSP